MKSQIVVLSALLLCSCTFSVSENVDSKLQVKIDGLGQNENVLADLEEIRKYPKDAVQILVNELQTTSDKKILIDDQKEREHDMHIVWCIRALRYVTGIDFKGSTEQEFIGTEEENRARLLNMTADGEVSFFGVRQSRETIYLAPTDAQRSIIRKWKDWITDKATTYEFPEPPLFSAWYF